MRAFLALVAALPLCGFTPEPTDIAGWTFDVSKDAESGINTVPMPTRDGRTAISFTLSPGSCVENDCSHDRERRELKQTGEQHEGESWWYAWSFFIPDSFAPVWPARVFLGQFHQEDGDPAMLFSLEPSGLVFESRFFAEPKPLLISADMLKGRWHDVVMQVTWSKTDGHVQITVDGERIVDRAQQTMSEVAAYFKFGIYRAHLSRYAGAELPVHHVIYDRIRRAKTSDGLKP